MCEGGTRCRTPGKVGEPLCERTKCKRTGGAERVRRCGTTGYLCGAEDVNPQKDDGDGPQRKNRWKGQDLVGAAQRGKAKRGLSVMYRLVKWSRLPRFHFPTLTLLVLFAVPAGRQVRRHSKHRREIAHARKRRAIKKNRKLNMSTGRADVQGPSERRPRS